MPARLASWEVPCSSGGWKATWGQCCKGRRAGGGVGGRRHGECVAIAREHWRLLLTPVSSWESWFSCCFWSGILIQIMKTFQILMLEPFQTQLEDHFLPFLAFSGQNNMNILLNSTCRNYWTFWGYVFAFSLLGYNFLKGIDGVLFTFLE